MKNMTQEQQKQLKEIFRKEGVILAYLFGSQARGTAGFKSDIDIAVLFSKEQGSTQCLEQRMFLASKIEDVTALRNVDVVCLNEAPPLLKHRAVLSGQLLYAANSQIQRGMELRALQEYEDFRYHLAVSYKAMRKHIFQKTFGKAPLPFYNAHKF